MKKVLTILALCLVLALSVTACGGKNGTGNTGGGNDQTENNTPTVENEPKDDGYLFEVNGVSIGADMDMAKLTEKLGEAKSTFEAPSCAGQGTAYVYSYGSFEIETYPEDGVDRVGFIILKDDTVATAEGIDLSKTRDDVVAAYGDGYEESDNGLTYSKGNMKLNFIFDGDSLVSIEYVSKVVG